MSTGSKNGIFYFYVHFLTESCCFFALSRVFGNSLIMWCVPLIYDFLAFVPQILIGDIADRFPKFIPGLWGTVLLASGLLLFPVFGTRIVPIILIAIGNAFIHVNGAEVTLRTGNGRITPAAVFVAGGSFGIVVGKLLAHTPMPFWVMAVVIITAIPFVLLCEKNKCTEIEKEYDFASKEIMPELVVILATIVVAVRGYMGYGIPTSWNKTTFQMILLYGFMGTGKALGGIFVDRIGLRKTIYISVLLALPLLLFGDNHMIISLIGVMFFSMTMSVTLGLLVSVYNNRPGFAFGFTTIGLFLGVLPIFFFTIKSFAVNCVVISLLSVLCLFFLLKISKKEVKVKK